MAVFELLHEPLPDGYGEAVLSLDDAKAHCSVESSDDDDLIAALRDAAVEFVERYCSVRLRPVTGLIWKAEGFPASSRCPLVLGVRPVTAITAISWKDSNGDAVTGTVGDYRVSLHGEVLPVIGGDGWPTDVGGEVQITFTAGYETDETPTPLIAAVRLFLGHLYRNREAIVCGTQIQETPLGVKAICAPYRKIPV